MTTTVLPSWVQILSALLTPAIATLVVFVAHQQWRIARDKLKLDLFDRRLAIHNAARSLIATVTSTGKIDNKDVFEFLNGIQQARWILNIDIANYFEKELWPQVTKLQELIATLDSSEENRTENIRKQIELKNSIVNQREN